MKNLIYEEKKVYFIQTICPNRSRSKCWIVSNKFVAFLTFKVMLFKAWHATTWNANVEDWDNTTK